MIEKRFQYTNKDKQIVWSDWYTYSRDDSEFEELSQQKWQLKNKYLQEFRKV